MYLQCLGVDQNFFMGSSYLEDHPRTCKWLITMVIVSSLSRDIPLPNGLNGLLMGVTNQLLSGMILQVGDNLINHYSQMLNLWPIYMHRKNVERPTRLAATSFKWRYTWRIIPVTKYLASMVIVSLQDLWLWDPFQMTSLWIVNGGGS